ncbi:uncharacterized protein PHACADRAFT_260041 [Phanerochaete carnosa HHB-10118-sp]|uniref:Uncharacterized protein n=1 Tax=Phanerochaete carnosa (strain HHB-10118-sp) TaxID=650164 RepID=K5WT41_PHACS|nr:uncharacterized protein PHACADRAFT_260041 [Phanerochaete carnosa HHB-10118-sp]EKM53602.1 hypothetical protein PHACADRAFT_260041 [Phanerochaete carnosa HHB-10118-sp]
MAPSSFSKHRFQNSLDLAAARAMRNVGRAAQSGTGNAWCIVDSPTLGRMSSVSRRSEERQPAALGSRLVVPVADIAPLNIKKIRRRGLVSGIHLVLPPSPLPLASSTLVPPSQPSSTPGTALTFTAEWDLTQKTFVFTPYESEYPTSADGPRFLLSPVPVNVEEDPLARGTAPSTPAPYTPSSVRGMISPAPASAPIRRSWSGDLITVTDELDTFDNRNTPSSGPNTPVSPLFDSPPRPPKRHCRERNDSQSTAASSITDLSSPGVETPPPPPPPPKDVIALHVFGQELHRAVSAGAQTGELSEECYAELDEDLLLAPMDVFEKTLWDATLPERRRTRRKARAESRLVQHRPPSDVPRNAQSSAFSIYSADSFSLPGGPSSAKGSLRQQITKALSSTLHFRR